jgi:hypothetical protein
VGAAQAALREGQLDVARRRLGAVDDDSLDHGDSPPWVAAWARLLRAQMLDAGGAREQAVVLYNEVLQHPIGQAELRRGAEAGLKAAWSPVRGEIPRRERVNYSK